MKKCAAFFCLAVICLSFTYNFAQSGRNSPNSDSGTKKVNRRPPQAAPTPTPTPAEDSETATETTANNTNIDANAEVDDSDVISVSTEIVTVPVKVMDRSGKFIGGLTKENFTVFENNVQQEIEYFSNEQQPFTVALVLDMSYSAKFKAAEIQNAAIGFISQLRPNDKVMVISFAEEILVHCEPTSDRDRIYRAIKATKINYGTSLYDAMDLVINQKLRKITGRKAVVLFTDGVDTSSTRAHNMSNVSDALELDALIYPIKYDTYAEVQAMKNKPVVNTPTQRNPLPTGSPTTLPFPFPFPTGGGGVGGGGASGGGVGTMSDRGTTPEEYAKGEEYLNDLANRTGGRIYNASTTDNLATAFANIASELREFYSLGYIPKDAKAGKKNKIKVKVDRENVSVQARDGYVVGKKKK